MTLLQIFYSNAGRNGPWHLNKSHNLKILSLIYPDQQSNLRVDRCLHYGGAMSGPISHPASTGGWVWTTLDIVHYISDTVFFFRIVGKFIYLGKQKKNKLRNFAIDH